MKMTIPHGSEIKQSQDRSIKIKIQNTEYWVEGEQLPDKTWNVYLVDPLSTYKELIKSKAKTSTFALFSGIVLKTPFPYDGKKAENSKTVKSFVRKLIKTKTKKRILCHQTHQH